MACPFYLIAAAKSVAMSFIAHPDEVSGSLEAQTLSAYRVGNIRRRPSPRAQLAEIARDCESGGEDRVAVMEDKPGCVV
jgi:hypothetical protein